MFCSIVFDIPLQNLPHPEAERAQFIAAINQVRSKKRSTKQTHRSTTSPPIFMCTELNSPTLPLQPTVCSTIPCSLKSEIISSVCHCRYAIVTPFDVQVNTLSVWSPHKKQVRPWIEMDELSRRLSPGICCAIM